MQRLSPGAMERVARAAMAAADVSGLRRAVRGISAAKGHLLEELSAVRIQNLLKTPEGRKPSAWTAGRCERKGSLHRRPSDPGRAGGQLTDGIIGIQRADRFEIVTVIEAKAGKFAAGGLTEALGGLTKASTSDIVEALFELSGRSNRGVMAQIAKSDPELHKALVVHSRSESRSANVAGLGKFREALMEAVAAYPMRT